MTEPISPSGLKQLIARGNAAWEREDYASALMDYLEVLRTHPDFPDIRNRAGFCRAMLGDPEGSLEDFDQAIRVNPEYAEAHLNRALILNDMGRYEEAREAFERARELTHRPGDPYPADLGNRIAVEHAKLGDLYLSADQPAAAVQEFRKALDVRPNFLDVRSRMAQALMVQEKLEPAIAELEEVLAEHPSFVSARVRLGVAFHRLGRTEDAVAEWRRCLEVEPKDRRARAYLRSVGVRLEEIEVEPPGENGAGAEDESA